MSTLGLQYRPVILPALIRIVTFSAHIFTNAIPKNTKKCKIQMRNQKPISARIYHDVLWRIDREVKLGSRTRNAIINDGADLYCSFQEFRREFSMYKDEDVRRKILRGFFYVYAPEILDIL